jgi:hypothetical protein
VGKHPDISDLLQIIERARVLREQHLAAEAAAKRAMGELIKRYEAAGITYDECNHPVYAHRSADSINACCYCQKRLRED